MNFSQQGEGLFYIISTNDDMAACDGVRYSSTLFFQQQFDFTGILIESGFA